MPKFLTALFAFLTISACGAVQPADDLGDLSLALSTRAGGQTYRLTKAEFVLDGPSTQEFAAEGDDPIVMTLATGSYTLLLKEGWVLAREGDTGMTPVAAKLDSQNPAALVIGPGAVTEAMLRFSLSDGTPVEMASGMLNIGVAIGGDDAGLATNDTCTHGLVINEIDYEQTGADDAEFIEILNTASCAANLATISLEYVNGGDSKVYGRSALSAAGETLAAGARLVVGHAKVLATLPSDIQRVTLGSTGLQNGAPDAVRIMDGTNMIDAVSYEGQVAGATEGAGAASDDGEGTFSRCPDGFDKDDNATDFRLVSATPGAVNLCP